MNRLLKYTDLVRKFDLSELAELEAAGLVHKQVGDGVLLFDYTKTAQYSNQWTNTLLQCRGLILDTSGNVKARPYPKFFNFEEHIGEELDLILDEVKSGFKVFDKEDGSFGILYKTGGLWKIATRGSFMSEQAIEATKILWCKYGDILPKLVTDFTYIVEIIYPENRIVCNYGDTKDLILTGIRDTLTGADLDLDKFNPGFTQVKEWKGLSDFSAIRSTTEGPNREGVVVLFKSGIRVKLKQADYVYLHKKITNISSRDLWKMFSSNIALEDILADNPDESWDFIKKWETVFREHISKRVAEILDYIKEVEAKITPTMTKKDIYELVKNDPNRAHFYSWYDYTRLNMDIFWEEIYPKRETPFRQTNL